MNHRNTSFIDDNIPRLQNILIRNRKKNSMGGRLALFFHDAKTLVLFDEPFHDLECQAVVRNIRVFNRRHDDMLINHGVTLVCVPDVDNLDTVRGRRDVRRGRLVRGVDGLAGFQQPILVREPGDLLLQLFVAGLLIRVLILQGANFIGIHFTRPHHFRRGISPLDHAWNAARHSGQVSLF